MVQRPNWLKPNIWSAYDVVVLDAALERVRARHRGHVGRRLRAPVVLRRRQEVDGAVVADLLLVTVGVSVVGLARPLLARVLAARLEQQVRAKRRRVLADEGVGAVLLRAVVATAR